MAESSWAWIALQTTLPSVLAGLVAYPIWVRAQPILGNLAGTTIVCVAALAAILRESLGLDRVARGCIDAGFACPPEPSAFARYAIYAFVALFQMIVLFSLSLVVETRVRRRGYDPRWR